MEAKTPARSPRLRGPPVVRRKKRTARVECLDPYEVRRLQRLFLSAFDDEAPGKISFSLPDTIVESHRRRRLNDRSSYVSSSYVRTVTPPADWNPKQ